MREAAQLDKDHGTAGSQADSRLQVGGREAAEYDNQRVWFFLVYQYVVFGLIHAFMEVRIEC